MFNIYCGNKILGRASYDNSDRKGEQVTIKMFYYKEEFGYRVVVRIYKNKLVKRLLFKAKLKVVKVFSTEWGIDLEKDFNCDRLANYVKLALEAYDKKTLNLEAKLERIKQLENTFKNGCQ